MTPLFPRQWDQSRWQLLYNVDLALREVYGDLWGWGGSHGELIVHKHFLEVPVESWPQLVTQSTCALRSWFEVQHPSNGSPAA